VLQENRLLQRQHASGASVSATLVEGFTCPTRFVPDYRKLHVPCSQVSNVECSLFPGVDHCWLNTDPEAGREGTIEVTTDSAAKRALPVDAAAWQGWLYSGGHAPLCSHQVLSLSMTIYFGMSKQHNSLSSVGPLIA